ncbi:MAG: polyribonucleotide nucleotidyltransferase [Candidatus Pacebacteria bacterium]|nr:polyribonucleotide nucleotidyltransferase [Candidatus Paceibacterota bacterium]
MTNSKKYEIEVAGRPLTAEFSDLTEQANGSVVLKYGETTILATAVMTNEQKEGLDHFPLMVDYEEKFYAAGKILGSRFVRREGKPSDEAILNGRMIDRTIRPLFDKKIKNETQVVATALCVDENNDPDAIAILAASLALSCSDIPWDGPVSSVRVGKIDGKFVINPTYEEKKLSDIDLIICGKNGKVNMIEGKAGQIPEETILAAIETAMPELEKLENFQKKIASEIGKEKRRITAKKRPEELTRLFEKSFKERIDQTLSEPKPKKAHSEMLDELKHELMETVKKEIGSESSFFGMASEMMEETVNDAIHKNALEKNMRPDGRKFDEIRTLSSETGVLPRAHGSGLFYRGMTHVLSVATLGSPSDFLIIEGMEVSEKKHFIHHYNFPPFSVGEIGKLGNPGRRSIGHGALAEKALFAVIPPKEKFPYTIRVVSETLSSNGSSSMGSVCASTMALMDAGVPIESPVSGIAMGLMMKDENDYKVLTDIQGPEDHHGDTDFKVAGTEKGITALQMDVKIQGITLKMIEDILKQSRKARLEILEVIKSAIAEPKKQVSRYAPKIIIVQINPEKKGALIGPGGRTINKIIDSTGVEIDIEEDGRVFITGVEEEAVQKAKGIVEEITYEPKPGEIFQGVVTRIFEFGAMVEVKGGHEGLIHVSELAPFRVERVTDIVNTGDTIPVKLVNIDDMGRLNFSLKQADPNYASGKQQTAKPNNGESGNGGRGQNERDGKNFRHR